MLEKLYKWFGKTPMIGRPITLAYIGKRAKDCIQKNKDMKLDAETSKLAGKELETAIKNQCRELFKKEIQPIVDENGLPEEVVKPVRDKFIEELSKELSKRTMAQVTEKKPENQTDKKDENTTSNS
ncbi:MAG: hypothetical protein NZ455_07780 [Bacteroidia bacterium]|nr:hypothetical protein [Bacteroidia bacterium]MDW8347692.1 hypothetical protein [Bacteroidia bacterium]